MIGTTVAHYKILEKLGEGGMGEVFLAHDSQLKRKVALKFLPDGSDPEALARFKREAQTAAALNHPNIITVYEVGEYEDRPYIAMAYVEGEPLNERIARGDLPAGEAIDIAIQICDGLASAHQAGVVHRDIKPANILIDRDNRAKILDFGLAKLGSVSKITGEISTFGTIYYMSPEQVRGEGVGPRSDLFSLGALLYELLTGELPFKGDHSAAIIYSITNEDPKPLSVYNKKLTGAIDQIVMRLLAKDPAERYESAAQVAADLRNLSAGIRPVHSGANRGLLKVLLPTSAVFLAVILLLVVKPFRVQIEPDQSAIAAQNSLAIMYFENLANTDDPKRLGEIVTNLLITDLSESDYMEVVSSQRLYDILKLQGREDEKVVDRTTATEVATHAGANWMLMGTILQEEPHYEITSRLVDVETGKVTASQRVTGEVDEPIFALVDRLTEEIKSDLVLPAAAAGEKDAPIAEVTTHSTEAYRYYLDGVDYLNKYYGREARVAFQTALEHDSTFAMVYLRMATPLITESASERKRLIAKAVRFSDKVSTKERFYIMSRSAAADGDIEGAISQLENLIREYPNEKDAYKALGDIYRVATNEPEKVVQYYRKAIEIDPMDKFSYNILAYTYQALGDIDNYIWAIYQYISLAPDEANPYDSRGDLYAYSGKIDKAISSYRKALERKPDFYPSKQKIGHMHLFKREYEEARAIYLELAESDDDAAKRWGTASLALIPFYQGKVDAGIAMLQDELSGENGYDKSFLIQRIAFCASQCAADGQYERAMQELRKSIELYEDANGEEPLDLKLKMVILTAMLGDFDRAGELVDDLKRSVERDDRSRIRQYWLARGVLELERGDADAACESLEKAAGRAHSFYVRYYLARAYLEANRLTEAVNEFEELLRRFSEDRIWNPVLAVKAYYWLGVAFERTGRTEKAAEQYEIFLDIWRYADRDIYEVKEAKRRLDAIRSAAM